ncbi:hypothetical protein DY000_02049287 [Brassica cretica]|uniref:Uncharacterized protein n=1 Tax=Brassica cretica TaxID=69181 RepID=A0ABQ7ETI7_BRACR|nr:hypothetical protein DY000_02049287 [Brassica cretica]
MRRSRRTTLAIKRPHRQRLKRRSLTNKITSNRPNPRTYPKNKATKDVKVHAKRSLLHQSTTTLPITIFLQESRGTFDDRRKLEDATTLPERRKDQAEIGTKATAQRKSRRQRSNQTGKGSRREAVVITGEVSETPEPRASGNVREECLPPEPKADQSVLTPVQNYARR